LHFDVGASSAIGSGVVLMVISGIGIDGKIKALLSFAFFARLINDLQGSRRKGLLALCGNLPTISMLFAPSIAAFGRFGLGGGRTAREKAGWPLVGCL
jgi:hypothetical protein